LSKPTTAIFPIENGKLITPLDCNNLQLLNLDESNLSGGGGGGGGNDTGTTTAILKGDGAHGFADAVVDVDYASPASVALKEDSSTHDADITSVTDSLASIETSLALKASTAALTAGLALKADAADLTAYIATNDAAVALKANSADVTTALSGKADTGAVTSALAGKEPLLPTTSNDSYILARHNAGAGSAWFFVDPLTLGTTSQTFADGVENSSTTFTSATANFVANDVGKAITGSGIPAATTIASRTNSTTILLSAAATATATGVSFTIVNRVEIGGSGTVTTVGVTNNVSNLLTTSVSNATTSPNIVLDGAVVGANTFYGNATGFAGTAAFMTASAARTSLGGTTVGQAFFQLANPTLVGYGRINADNSVTFRTTAQTLGDLGAETALTFSTPLSRVGTTISIPAATDAIPGHLTAADHATFLAKVATTRAISTNAPLTGGGNLTADRTISIPVSTDTADGYLSLADHALFTAKPPNSRTISTTAPLTGGGDLSANRTLAIPRASVTVDGYLASTDFINFSSGAGVVASLPTSGSITVSNSSPSVTRLVLFNALTGNLTITLPPVSNYSAGQFIEFVDLVANGGHNSFDIILTRSNVSPGNDLIDNNAVSITLPRTAAYLRLNSNGAGIVGGGRWLSTKYYVDTFRSATDPTKTAGVDVSQQTGGIPGSLTLAAGASVTVKSLAPVLGTFLTGIADGTTVPGATGTLQTASVYQRDVLSRQDDITSTAGNSHVVPDTGLIDNVRLSASLSAPLTVTLPSTQGYANGQAIYFYDASGSVSTTFTVSLVGTGADTVNGGSSILLSRPFDNRRIIANPATSNWTVEVYGGVLGNGLSVGPFLPLTDAANISVACDLNLTEQHWKLLGTSGVGTTRTITVTGAREGERFRLKYTHYTTNDTLLLATSATPGNGIGVLTLSTRGAGVIDFINGTVEGGKIYCDNPILDLTFPAAAAYNTQADVGTSAGALNARIGSTTNLRYNSGDFQAGSSYSCGRIDVTLRTQGTPANLTGSLFLELCADDIRSTDAGAIVQAGNATVTNATTVLATDAGQRVSGTGITDPTYIGTVTPGVSFTMVTLKGGIVAKNASGNGTGVNIWGKVGTSLRTSDPSVSSTLTGTYGSRTFLIPAFSIVSGTTYHLVIHTDGPINATDYVEWRFQSGNPGHIPRNGSSLATCTITSSASNKANFITYTTP